MKIDFWFEFASTYTYPVAMKIEALAAERRVTLQWKPFLLGPIFAQQGLTDTPFNVYPAKGNYMWRDLERLCQADGLAYQNPSAFPRNGLTAARVVCAHAGEPWIPGFVRAVYAANFAQDLDIAKEDTLLQCLPFDAAEARSKLDAAGSRAAKQALRENTEHAVQLGIFGSPTLMVRDEMFWGGDRLEAAFQWAEKFQAHS